MCRSRSRPALVVLLLVSTPATAQDKRYAARVALHPTQTLTLSEVEEICADVTEAQARSGPSPMRAIVAHWLGAERLAVGRQCLLRVTDTVRNLAA